MSFASGGAIAALWACIVCVCVGAETAANGDLGRVIYVRREGAGVLIHAERGDVQLDLLAPRTVRIADARHPIASVISSVAAPVPSKPAEFKVLDPRFQAIETAALRIEIQREPLRIRILDRQGNLLLADDPAGGLGSLEADASQWQGRFSPEGGVWGFGRAEPIVAGPAATVDFTPSPKILPETSRTPRRALKPKADSKDRDHLGTDPGSKGVAGRSGLLVPPSPCGRLGGRCAVAFSAIGAARIEFPEPGRFRFVNGGPFEVFVVPASGVESYWAELRGIVGNPTFPPRWLFGMGFTIEQSRSSREALELPAHLRKDGFPIDWALSRATRQGTAGWNEPAGAMILDSHWRPGAEQQIKQLKADGIGIVFEAPSRAAAPASQIPPRVPVVSGGDQQETGDLASRFSALRESGMTHWLVQEDPGPTTATLSETSSLAAGAAGPRMRAQAWRQWLEADPDPSDRPFVLDRLATVDVERLGHFLAPWAIQPMVDRPSEAFRAACAAAESGQTLWGLELPVSAAAYPSLQAFRRWLQAAIAAPVVLLRAESWNNALPSHAPAEIGREMKRLWAVRERLRPLMYTLARQASEEGTPLCRPLPPEQSGEEGPSGREAALLLGPDLLFIAADAESGGVVRAPLPAGDWISLHDNRRLQGPRTLDLTLADDRVEAFARRGSVIPFQDKSEGSDTAYLVTRIYPSASGAFSLYEDGGDGGSYEKGESATTRIEWIYRKEESAFVVRVDGPQGGYSNQSAARSLMLQIDCTRVPRAVLIDSMMTSRLPFVAGPSRLLEAGPALRFKSAVLPSYPLWDYDGIGFVYVWLPKRGSLNEVKIHLTPSLAPSEAPPL